MWCYPSPTRALFFLPVKRSTWSTWSAVISLTSRAGELRSAPAQYFFLDVSPIASRPCALVRAAPACCPAAATGFAAGREQPDAAAAQQEGCG